MGVNEGGQVQVGLNDHPACSEAAACTQQCRNREQWERSVRYLILVISYVTLEDAFLDKILQALVCEVDADLVMGVGAANHVLWPREIKETDEGGEILVIQPLIETQGSFMSWSYSYKIEQLICMG